MPPLNLTSLPKPTPTAPPSYREIKMQLSSWNYPRWTAVGHLVDRLETEQQENHRRLTAIEQQLNLMNQRLNLIG